MPVFPINQDWKFHYGDQPSAFQKDYRDNAWETVTVPHDWSVTMASFSSLPPAALQ